MTKKFQIIFACATLFTTANNATAIYDDGPFRPWVVAHTEPNERTGPTSWQLDGSAFRPWIQSHDAEDSAELRTSIGFHPWDE
jgi:hypothetical protein